MIRGYLLRWDDADGPSSFPDYHTTSEVSLPGDTGADRTIISPRNARRLASQLKLDIRSLPKRHQSTGVGGRTDTRTITASLQMDTFITDPFELTILEPAPGEMPPIPSLLGRDVIDRFALFVEAGRDRVFLLDSDEAAMMPLPFEPAP